MVLMRRIRPVRYLPLSMLAWGGITVGMAFVTNAQGLLAARFLLVSKSNLYQSCNNSDLLLKGVFQAGFFPSIIVYFSLWYRKRDHTMRIAFLFGAAIISGALDGILVCIYRSRRKYNACSSSRHTVLDTWMVFVVYTVGNGCFC